MITAQKLGQKSFEVILHWKRPLTSAAFKKISNFQTIYLTDTANRKHNHRYYIKRKTASVFHGTTGMLSSEVSKALGISKKASNAAAWEIVSDISLTCQANDYSIKLDFSFYDRIKQMDKENSSKLVKQQRHSISLADYDVSFRTSSKAHGTLNDKYQNISLVILFSVASQPQVIWYWTSPSKKENREVRSEMDRHQHPL